MLRKYTVNRRQRLPCVRVSTTAGSFAVSADEAIFRLAPLPERLIVVADDRVTVVVNGRGIPFTPEAGYALG